MSGAKSQKPRYANAGQDCESAQHGTIQILNLQVVFIIYQKL